MHRHRHVDKLLPAFVLGDLPEPEAASVREHLDQCASCRCEQQRLETLLTCAEGIENVSVDEQTCRSAGRQILLAVQKEKTEPTRPELDSDGALMWRIIMRSPKTKLTLAAAAAIVVALLVIVPFSGGGITFAEVIQPILNAQTVVFDTILGEDEDGPVIHDIVKGTRIRRTITGMTNTMIIDLDAGKMLTLDPPTKGAAYIDIQGPIAEGTKSHLEFVREIITNLDDRPDLPVKQLGEKQIDGRKAYGLQVSEANATLTIWADSETRLPLRIEMLQGQVFAILKNIKFDVEVDDDLLSMDVPAGYTLAGAELDLTDFSEEDFIETLRLCAKFIMDGQFPDTMQPEDTMRYIGAISVKLGESNVSKEQEMQIGVRLGRGQMFLHVLAHRDEYTYAGKGVKLGDAETPIFWYRPQGAETYRVIYGDLSARDVEPQNLPK
jgi:hypothetical protein